MNSKQLRHVRYKQAKRLKEVGFDWECQVFYYNMFGTICTKNILAIKDYAEELCYLAPTVALALMWVRDVKGYDCFVCKVNNGEREGWTFRTDPGMNTKGCYATYEAAESALLDEFLML